MGIPGRWAGTIISSVLKIIHPVGTHSRYLLGLWDPLREIVYGEGYIIEHPVDKNSTRRIGVFANERQGCSPGREVKPGQGRGKIQTLAGEPRRDGFPFGKGG